MPPFVRASSSPAASMHCSILTPIGAALLGLSPAHTIDWPSPSGTMETLTVLNVTNTADSN